VAVGKLDGPDLFLVILQFVFLALLARLAGIGFDLVGDGIGIGTLVSEDILYCQDLRAEIGDVYLKFVAARFGSGVRLIVGLLQFLVIGALLYIVYGLVGYRLGFIKECGVALLPLVLEGFPGALSVILIP